MTRQPDDLHGYDGAMPAGGSDEEQGSPLADALERVGDRWTLLVIEGLMGGPRRFNDLQDELPASPRTFCPSGRTPRERGVGEGVPLSDRPPRVSYELTAVGSELAGALRLLAEWGARQSDHAEAPAMPPAARRWRPGGTAPPAPGSSRTGNVRPALCLIRSPRRRAGRSPGRTPRIPPQPHLLRVDAPRRRPPAHPPARCRSRPRSRSLSST